MSALQILPLILILSLSSTFLTKAQKSNSISLRTVETENGLISGTHGNDTLVMVFKGIPYAVPPVEYLRWKVPQPVRNWKGIRKCEDFGPSAMQSKPVPFRVWTHEFLIPKAGAINEDCLYLNLWTTAKYSQEKRPVIVYIHGGGFVNGSGSVPIYNGEAMAKKGIVFVTINYRLGVFGFFAHPELSRESPHHSSGNYGILDQIAALEWVQRNIAAFEGDPDNVTIAGQSAGSASVNILAASPLAKGLFAKMIAESAALVLPGRNALTLDSAEEKGEEFEKSVGASNLKQLREMPAEELFSAFQGGGAPIVDGYVLPEAVSEIFAENKQIDVPLLTGYNEDDIVFPASRTFGPYKAYVQKEFGKDSTRIFEFYPPTTVDGADHLLRDMRFGVQNFAWAMMQSEQGKSDAYFYFFKRDVPTFKDSTDYGAFHTGEVPYAYDNLRFLNRPLVKTDHELAELMSSYWVNFARKGNPNGAGLPYWPAFNKEEGKTMIFDSTSKVERHPYFEALEFLYERAIRY